MGKEYNVTANDIIRQLKNHVASNENYRAMTLVTDISNEEVGDEPWLEVNKDKLVKEFINTDTIKVLTDLGFNFMFYPFCEHTETDENGVETKITDSWALALIWYFWTPLKDIFKSYNLM